MSEAVQAPPASDANPPGVQAEPIAQVEQDRAVINAARAQGKGSLFGAFVKLSGPGWLQSAITLGGGSLTGSLYLGVLAGMGLLWLQPLAMILGIVMLSAIAYVTLSTGRRPFEAIKEHVNPVLAWAWAIATMLANLVWCMPQFNLGTAALQQNLFPDVFSDMDPVTGNIICVAAIFILAGIVSWFYESGGRGIKIFEMILKVMVGVVVISFFGVVGLMIANGQIDVGQMLSGFVPDVSLLWKPGQTFEGTLAATGEYRTFWEEWIVTNQQKVMITAAATAVGINMTFLLPYSMLARGWDRDFRGLAIFDLATGLFIPFLLATTCVVVAAASQFHAKPDSPSVVGLVEGNVSEELGNANLAGGYRGLLDERIQQEIGAEEFATMTDEDKVVAREALPRDERVMAAMLVKRDAGNLSGALKTLFGDWADVIFGIGVFGMAISTVIILMLINGFVICEMVGAPGNSTVHRAGAFFAACSGALGPFVWGSDEAKLWLAVPTSMFGAVLLPIAYVTFFFLMNSRPLLGPAMPTGGKRFVWNTLMGIAVALATFGSFWSIKTSDYPTFGFGIIGALLVAAVVAHFVRRPSAERPAA